MAVCSWNSFVGLRIICGYEASWVCYVARELCSLLKANQQGLHRRQQRHPNTMYCGWRCPRRKYRISRWVEFSWKLINLKRAFICRNCPGQLACFQKIEVGSANFTTRSHRRPWHQRWIPFPILNCTCDWCQSPDSHAHLLEYGAAMQLPLEGAKSIQGATTIFCLCASIAYSAPRCRCARQRAHPLYSWHL